MAPEQPEPSLVLSILSHPYLHPSRDMTPYPIPPFHPFSFLFPFLPLVPTDKRKKMKAGKGTLCLSLSLLAYFIGFILVVWPCLSLSYYFCLQLLWGAHVPHMHPPPPNTHTHTNAIPMSTHLHV